MNYPLPSVVWVRNGQIVDDTDSRITITPTTTTNGQLSSSQTITNFGQSDVGVYQCVFTDNSDGGDNEVITTLPHRLDTGNIVTIERVSPEVIILRPPEKLVIEVKSSGEYAVHFWRKNENIFTLSGFPATLPDEFPNFAEIYVRDPTTLDDEGVYRVSLELKPGTVQTHQTQPSLAGVDFAVIAPVDANTTALNDTVVILEGGSADISCRSVGAPAPSITWELDNKTTCFEQTDTVTKFEASLTGTVGGQRDVDLTPGSIMSDLHIVNARYPDHDGVYECIGSNADDLVVASSTALVIVQVYVIPEVVITTNNTVVNRCDDLTLTCSVLRGNPTNYTYSIIHVSNVKTTLGPTLVLTDIQQSDLGTYRCDVTNEAGTGSANITIALKTNECQAGMYKEDLSTGESVCLPCPAKSISTVAGSRECTCFDGYYRAALEGPDFPCSASPSSCRNLQVVEERTRATTITVRWERPEITGRDDFYYNIFYTEDNKTFTQHNSRPYMKQDALVDYSLSGLKSLTTYTIRVTVENGVSGQEKGDTGRSCQTSSGTGDLRANAPPRVLGFCTNVVWTSPTRSYGKIIGYDVRFIHVRSGSDDDGLMKAVMVTKGNRQLFHVIGDEIAQSDNTLVQVRAKTSSADGIWSEPVPLGCSGSMQTTCPACP